MVAWNKRKNRWEIVDPSKVILGTITLEEVRYSSVQYACGHVYEIKSEETTWLGKYYVLANGQLARIPETAEGEYLYEECEYVTAGTKLLRDKALKELPELEEQLSMYGSYDFSSLYSFTSKEYNEERDKYIKIKQKISRCNNSIEEFEKTGSYLELYEPDKFISRSINGKFSYYSRYATRNVVKHKNKKDVCHGCKCAAEHKNDTVNHGVSAYNHADDVYDVLDRIEWVIDDPNWEVCCSNKDIYLGPIGVTSKAKIVSWFPIDVCSSMNEEGKRYITPKGIKRLTNYTEKGVVPTDHDEYWVTNMKPMSIWVKKWWWNDLYDEDKDILAKKAEELNLDLIFIESRHNK